MPPYLAIPHYHLSRLPLTTKWAVTLFDVSLLAAILFSAFVLFEERTGFTRRGVEVNFVGTEHLQKRGEIVEEEVSAKTSRQVYDIVHPHSFLMPVIFFILCHMMEMAYAPRWGKLALYTLGALAMLAVTFAPLLIAWKIPMAAVLIPAVLLLTVTFGAMIVIPGVQMWVGEGKRGT